ncbi:MAG: RNA methyltransferase [Butyrivibrio sp.]|nr:RNA methyltransferase [Butyrivibrio sp.]
MITSTSNANIKRVNGYISKSRDRKKDGVFVVEGFRMIREIPHSKIRELYVSENFLKKASAEEKDFLNKCGVKYEQVTNTVFDKLSDTRTPQGILAVVEAYEYKIEDVINAEKPLILILENIQDPGNLGTMFRAGEGAGVSGIIMSRGSADVYNPKVIRSTMGSIFRVPFVYTDSVPEVASLLGKKGIKTYAAHLRGKKNYDEMDYTKGTAFLIGNEGAGLTAEAADSADEYVLIPMLGKVESMNAATSAALMMFEAARQRRHC